MTTSNVLIINPKADFEEQLTAIRGLLFLISDSVRAMEACVTPDAVGAIVEVNNAVIEWVDSNLPAELEARTTPADDVASFKIPKLVAAE